MLRIRPASIEDAALICSLIHELGEYEHLSDQVVVTEDRLRQTLFGEHPRAEVLISEWSDEAAGFALFFHNYSTFLGKPGIYLEDLFVRPWARGKGIGQAMLSSLAKLAVERECGRLEWAVLDWNEPAIGFYKKLGAVPLNDWTLFRLSGAALETLGSPG